MPDKQIHYHFDKKPSKSKFDKQASALKKTTMILFVIIFSGLILAYSLANVDEPFVNQTVGVNDNMLNLPRSELNGLSLNEVFEDNNLYDLNDLGIGDLYGLVKNGNIYTSDNNISTRRRIGTSLVGYQLIVDNKYYVNLQFTSSHGNFDRYRIVQNLKIEIASTFNTFTQIIFNTGGTVNYYDFEYFSLTLDLGEILIIELLDFKTINLTSLGIDNLTVEQMDYYYNLYKTLSASNQQVTVYQDNWSLSDKETVGIGGLTAVTGFLASVEKISATIEMAKNMFVNIIENDIILKINNTLSDIGHGLNDFYTWLSEKLGIIVKPPPITVPIKPIWPVWP